MNAIELPIIDRRDGVQDAQTCRACGGKCCHTFPGITHPSDFGPRETLAEALAGYLRSGWWCVDWWEGDPREGGELTEVYYVRPMTIDGRSRNRLRDPSWGGPCALWCAGHGCSLAFQNRPYECRHLKPNPAEYGDCKSSHDKQWIACEWIPYQAEVIAALEAVERDTP